MYVNVACTCMSQVILSFIFSMMSEPIEIFENPCKNGWDSSWEIRRDNVTVFKIECPKEIEASDKESPSMLSEPLNTGINKHVTDMFSDVTGNSSVRSNSSPANPYVERNLKEAKLRNDTIRQLI